MGKDSKVDYKNSIEDRYDAYNCDTDGGIEGRSSSFLDGRLPDFLQLALLSLFRWT